MSYNVVLFLSLFIRASAGTWGIVLGDWRYQVTLSSGPSVLQAPGDGFLWVLPASRVAMDTSSLLVASGHPLTLQAPAPKLITSDEFKCG